MIDPLEHGPGIMLALKLLFIPLFFFARRTGLRVLRVFGIERLDAKANRTIGLLILLFVSGAVILAAAARLLFDLEPWLPPFARMHATHLKWFLAQGVFVIAFGVAYGAFSLDTPKRRERLSVVSLALFGAFLLLERRYTRPVYEACADRVEAGVTRQTFESTCGPASLCNLLREFGVEARERDAARIARTRPTGTTGDELARAVPLLAPGFRARYFKLDLPAMERVGLPCVLSFGEEHFVTWLSRRAHLHVYIDPSVGRCMYKDADLLAEWDGKTLYILPEPFDIELEFGARHPDLPALRKALAGAGQAAADPGAPAGTDGDLADAGFVARYRAFAAAEGLPAPARVDPYVNLLVFARARASSGRTGGR